MRKIQKFNIKFEKPRSKKSWIVWFVLIGILVAKIYLTIQLATLGASLAYYEKKSAEVTKESFSTSDELAGSSSLIELEKKSDDYGFTKNLDLVYLKDMESVAKAD